MLIKFAHESTCRAAGWRILRFEDGWREVGRRELELGPKPRIAANSRFRICLRDPAASCALGSGRNAHEYTSTPESPDVPARNGFNGFLRALPGDRAVLPPSPADMFCLSPVGPTRLRKLDASVGASGPRDFAVRCNIPRPLAW